MLITIDEIYGSGSRQQPPLSANHGADGAAHLAGAARGERQISAFLEGHARMETIDLDVMTLTILIHEDSLVAVARQLDALEHLIARYGTQAFFGEPDAEPPLHTA
jgi:hypothetical protein